ncbi:hypothetical protein [Pseudonocardia pini]|uniref:hypothetical protein n=1 Tax=Pseudonocardia pini TaxID=2758030 RepID=UPI0015F01D2E|nr:hypothetical protein [Pseudonocardia pini]
MTPQDRAALDRAAFRAFVREHHPDRGGDPEVFAAGMARFREPPADPRFDAPVVFVPTPPLPVRIVVAAIRTARRRSRTRVDRPSCTLERE